MEEMYIDATFEDLSKYYIYQLMHKSLALKVILKFTLKQLLHVLV